MLPLQKFGFVHICTNFIINISSSFHFLLSLISCGQMLIFDFNQNADSVKHSVLKLVVGGFNVCNWEVSSKAA